MIMASLLNSSRHQQPAQLSFTTPDSVLSSIVTVLGDVNGWTILLATLIAIVAYDQGITFQTKLFTNS